MTSIKTRVAIIQKNDSFRAWLVRSLEREGFDIGLVVDSIEVDPLLASNPDIVLLDIDQDGDSDEGFRMCAELRLRAPVLLIVFLSDSDYECDRVSAYRVGADDYLTKKVSSLLLGVRLAALRHRRETLMHKHSAAKRGANLDCSSLNINTDEWTATWQKKSLDLSVTRLRILSRLVEIPGRVCTSQDLMTAADIRVEHNTVTAHIKAIRDEFKRLDKTFDHIRSERSIGYRWVSA